VQESAGAGDFTGVVLVVEHGSPVWHQAYGEGVALDTQMDVASVGKMFTAVAVAQLVEAGKLSFEDPVGRYLPDLPDAIGEATIDELLSHTAGLGMMQIGTELVYEPGEFHYSNGGFILLGQAVEAISDEPFSDYLEEHVFQPSGMTSTGFEGAIGYGHGGELSTAADLLRFADALFDYRLLDEGMTTTLTTPKIAFEHGSYGYGFGIFGKGTEIPSVGHIGALPNIVAAVEINPQLEVTIVILCTSGFEDAPELIAYQTSINMGYFRG
jgi:CubicO group peptidase (beta-lactamase class C family)